MPQKPTIEEVLEDWCRVCKSVLLTVENRLRKKKNLGPLPRNVAIYFSKEAALLLNLKVWTLRYHVDLEFILFELLSYYRGNKGSPYLPPNPRHRFGCLGVGVNLATLCGDRSRQILEDKVAKTYPAGGNDLAYRQSLRLQVLQTAPVKGLHYHNFEEMTAQYQKTMHSRHVKKDEIYFSRAWRDNPWR